jgi:hypothetical protein
MDDTNYQDLDTTSKETVPLIANQSHTQDHYFDISKKLELGRMAKMFFVSKAVKMLYLSIAIYLYGDLAIYATTISKSLRDVTWLVTILHMSV